MRSLISRLRNREKGQGLVEAALFMPIFIVILTGLVEVTQIVVDQNRVSNAARTGARYMANGGDDHGMVRVSLNAITQTVVQDESSWDIWSIRATVNSQGDGFSEWSFDHVYGISNTVRFAEVSESGLQAQVLAELQKGQNAADVADLRIVAAYLIHDVNSIAKLDAIPWLQGYNSIKALSVMRIFGFVVDTSGGCDAFPIAIHEDITSLNPTGSPSNAYPPVSEFGIHSPKPTYGSFVARGHEPAVALLDMKTEAHGDKGYVFKVQNGFGSGNFGWLRWNVGRPDDSNTLSDSLTWPGNSKDYLSTATGGSGVGTLGRILGYVEPGDPSDVTMHIGDWVAANTGNVNSAQVRTALTESIDKDRELRVILWNTSDYQGGNGVYQISRFAVFRLHGFKLSSSDSWILAEFVKWDEGCGDDS